MTQHYSIASIPPPVIDENFRYICNCPACSTATAYIFVHYREGKVKGIYILSDPHPETHGQETYIPILASFHPKFDEAQKSLVHYADLVKSVYKNLGYNIR